LTNPDRPNVAMARTLIISVGTIGRPQGLSLLAYQALGSVMAAGFWRRVNG
jgi:hypothetical protein